MMSLNCSSIARNSGAVYAEKASILFYYLDATETLNGSAFLNFVLFIKCNIYLFLVNK